MLPISSHARLFACTMLLYATAACAEAKNGFVLDDALVPAQEILQGGPAKDGIPSIDTPKFFQAQTADFLKDDDRILGIEIDGAVRAYPVSILNWHEIVNDSVQLCEDARSTEIALNATFLPIKGFSIHTSANTGQNPATPEYRSAPLQHTRSAAAELAWTRSWKCVTRFSSIPA